MLYNRLLCLAFALGPWNSAHWLSLCSAISATTVGVRAYLLPCYGEITFTPCLQSYRLFFFIKMHHKQRECVCNHKKKKKKKTIYSLLVCKFDMTWLLSIRWWKIRAAATRQSDGRRLWGAACWVQGGLTRLLLCGPVWSGPLCIHHYGHWIKRAGRGCWEEAPWEGGLVLSLPGGTAR